MRVELSGSWVPTSYQKAHRLHPQQKIPWEEHGEVMKQIEAYKEKKLPSECYKYYLNFLSLIFRVRACYQG